MQRATNVNYSHRHVPTCVFPRTLVVLSPRKLAATFGGTVRAFSAFLLYPTAMYVREHEREMHSMARVCVRVCVCACVCVVMSDDGTGRESETSQQSRVSFLSSLSLSIIHGQY